MAEGRWRILLSDPHFGPEEAAAVRAALASGWVAIGSADQAQTNAADRYPTT